jgi:Ca2+-binding RTX toxin-like protein
MANFSVLNDVGLNGAGIQFGTLAQIAASGVDLITVSPTVGVITFNDGGRLDFQGFGFAPGTFSGAMTSFVYSNQIGETVFSVVGFAEPLADIVPLVTGGDELAVLADLFSENDTITGSSVDDRLIGFAGADAMDGGDGIDTLSYRGSLAGGVMVSLVDGSVGTGGDAEGDTITGFENLVGSEGHDVLDGNAGNNVLAGRGGDDFLIGHLGNDSYNVDSVGDFAVEVVGQGTDTVYSSVSYALTVHQSIEKLVAVSTAGAIALTGNEFAQSIVGNASDNLIDGGDGGDAVSGNGGDDELRGGSGDDLLKGSGGEDTLLGGDGNDVLNGRSYGPTGDADVLRGGLGNDSYTVDSALDVVDETGGGGIDTVTAHVEHTLAAGVENLVMLPALVYGTGNDLANYIRGSNLFNTLRGEGGDDRLAGGFGSDVLWGGAGRDRFDYDRVEDSRPVFHDQIADFARGEDRIDLATIDADLGTAGNQAFTFIGGAAFTAAGQVRVTQTSSLTIVEGNVDGGLTEELEIMLSTRLTLAASDFVL